MPSRVLGTVTLLAAACVTACEHDQRPAPRPAPRDASHRDASVEATCELVDDQVHLDSALALSFHGRWFATVSGLARHAEVHVTDREAIATVTDDKATLTGDVDRAAIRVRPRNDALVDGWLAIRSAPLGPKTSDATDLSVEIDSSIVVSRVPSVHVACRDLTLGALVDNRYDRGTAVHSRPGRRSPIAREPHGAPFGELVTPPRSDTSEALEALVTNVHRVAQRDGSAQIVVRTQDADVVGWVPQDALEDPPGSMLGNLVDDDKPDHWVTERCPDAMPIYVTDGKATERVGTTIAGAKLDTLARKDGTLALDLGAELTGFSLRWAKVEREPPPLRPSVRGADATRCSPSK